MPTNTPEGAALLVRLRAAFDCERAQTNTATFGWAMSKMLCSCGHVIRDQTDRLPYKAELYPDADTEALWGGVVATATSLLEALGSGERLRWMKEHFLPGYPADVSDDGMLSDAITAVAVRLKRDVYQCEVCARLYVQTSSKENSFAVFAPESQNARNCLRGELGLDELAKSRQANTDDLWRGYCRVGQTGLRFSRYGNWPLQLSYTSNAVEPNSSPGSMCSSHIESVTVTRSA